MSNYIFIEAEEEQSEVCCYDKNVTDSIYSVKMKSEEFKKPGSKDQFWAEPWYPIRKFGKFPSKKSFKKYEKEEKTKCSDELLCRFLNSLTKHTLLKLPE